MNLPTNKLNFIGVLGFGLASLSLSVNAAEGLSYTYLELDYINLDIDEVGDSGSVIDDLDNGSGWGARGSFALSPSWFAFAEYSVTESDASFVDDLNQFFSSDTDIHRLDLGVGYHNSMNANTDLVLRAAYTDIDTDEFDFGATGNTSINDLQDDSSDGFFVDAGVRSQLMDRLEGSVGVRYTDLENFDNLSVIGNLMYEFSPSMGLNFGIEAGSDISHYLLGLRFSF